MDEVAVGEESLETDVRVFECESSKCLANGASPPRGRIGFTGPRLSRTPDPKAWVRPQASTLATCGCG